MQYRSHCDQFFRRAEEIVELDASPLEVGFLLDVFASTMNDTIVLFGLSYLALTRLLRVQRKPPRMNPLLQALEDSPNHVKRQFFNTYQQAMYAVSYRSAVLGPLVRTLVTDHCQRPDGVSQEVIRRVVKHGQRHVSVPLVGLIHARVA